MPGTRGPDRWIVYPVLFCRFYYPNRKFYSNKLWRDKQDRQEDLPLETAKHFVHYALPTKLSRCNDHAVDTKIRDTSSSQPGTLSLVIGALGCLRQFDFDFEDEDPSASPSPSASKSSSTLSGLATFVHIFLFSGTRIPDRYGNRVPGSKNIRKHTGLVSIACYRACPTVSWSQTKVSAILAAVRAPQSRCRSSA